jgi:DNA-binding NarL/FixJ family response regulator
MKVLIADSSKKLAQRLTALISEIPSVELLRPATTGRETLESVRANDVQVLVLDSGILAGRGKRFLKAIRLERPAAVVIILSNYFYPQYQRHYESAGADLFMDKSNDLVQLDQLLRELASAPRTTELRRLTAGLRKHVSPCAQAGLRVCLFMVGVSSLLATT